MYKLIVVTGDPRSGTSLMMRALDKLDITLLGDKFPGQDRISEKFDTAIEAETDLARKTELESTKEDQIQKMVDKNPGGFYEIPVIVMRGLSSEKAQELGILDKLQNERLAIKIMSPGAISLPNKGTPETLVDKYIFCLRNPKHVAISQSKLSSNASVPSIDGTWKDVQWNADPYRWLVETNYFFKWALNSGRLQDILVVDYDDWFNDVTPAGEIAAHLGIQVDSAKIAEVDSLVDKSLRRSPSDFIDYNADIKYRGELADSFYVAIKTMDADEVAAISVLIDEEQAQMKLENARWFEPSVGTIINPLVYRKMKQDDGFFSALRGNFLRGLKIGLSHLTSPDYSEPSDAPEYTIERPADLGPITRKKVKYKADIVTHEQAKRLYWIDRAKQTASFDESLVDSAKTKTGESWLSSV